VVFDIGLGELLVLGLLALLVFGPDRLPGAAASAGRFVNRTRETLTQARSQISESVDMDDMTRDLQGLADLHPKRMLSSLAEPAEAPKPSAAPSASPPIDPNAT
jgi:sec-independent protein translocase protein TatB